ncbi:hypothetical protein EB232_14745 [Mesorhizobium sp. NZP2077]|nr:hypothetical protein EB232_14745 [Mesorhizobium sp. NZP2077]
MIEIDTLMQVAQAENRQADCGPGTGRWFVLNRKPWRAFQASLSANPRDQTEHTPTDVRSFSRRIFSAILAGRPLREMSVLYQR